jgi:beta-galactosidase
MKRFSILLSAFFISVSLSAANQPKFSTAGFFPLAGTGRTAYSMNVAWRFVKTDVKNAELLNFDDSKWEVVSLPHGLEYLPKDASGGINYQGPAWYRKHFTLDAALKGKKLFLHFEAVMGNCKVWVNGKLLTEHVGGYLPVIADVSNNLKWGEDNVIAVWADNSDDPSFPPGKAQNLLDFCYFGGIYRDCWLIETNNVHITDPNYENEVAGGGVFVSYDKVSDKSALVNIKTHIRNELSTNFAAEVIYELKQTDGKTVNRTAQKLNITSGKAAYSMKGFELKQPKLWSPETPYLYWLNVYVKDSKGNIVDGYSTRIGIRSIEFKQKSGLWINGKPYDKIIGTNRHQDFAVIGNALPNSIQWRDAKKLRDAGMKVIRTHYVIDPAFMDACDELGIFALVETPGWQFWSDAPIFGERVYSDIRNMIRIHRNHASLFFWEPILNETSYPKDFAKNAAEICKQEYPYPYSTSACDDGADGAQYFSLLLRPKSNLDSTKTYFVREWGDNVDDWSAQNSDSRVNRNWGEVPMLIQAKHYAKPDYNVLCLESLYKSSRQIVGGCFWHSFDHQRGYHPDPQFAGIMDAFRQPKTSYYMFMSQRSPVKSDLMSETGPMVYIANEMTPFSPNDVTVYSNCDEVRLTFLKNGKQETYKKDSNLNGMPSPIITFKNMFDFMACKAKARAGKQNEVYLLAEGLINGKVVATHKVCPAESPDHIRLRLDNDSVDLIANGSDIVTVIAELVDKKGTVKRLNSNSIRFSIEGEGRLLGDESTQTNTSELIWGSAPVMLQSTTKAGKIRITASLVHEGSQTPVGGELIFNSVVDTTATIINQNEANLIGKQKEKTVRKQTNKSELELENERLRKEINDLKVNEVGKQQNKFGTGIN